MKPPAMRTRGERWYRLLLGLYPRLFRERFRDEMVAFFRARSAEPRHTGSAGNAMRLWTEIAGDLARSLAAAWMERARMRGHRRSSEHRPPFPLPPEDRMDSLVQDLRFALRSIVRRPGFAIVTMLTLALGIGANTAMFSVVETVLLRPLPWPDAGRLVFVFATRGGDREQGVAYLDYLDWKRRSTSFAELGVIRGQSVNLTGGETPDRLIGSFATASALRVLRTRAASGRLFTDRETDVATREPVAVISDALWRARFGARSDMLGSALVLNGQSFTVIGILPAGYQAPLFTPDIWLPIGFYPNKGDLDTRGRGGVMVIGRLRAGVSTTRAQSDLGAVTQRLAKLYPTTNTDIGASVEPLEETLFGSTRTPLLLALAAVGIVLLIACANIANLQLARAAARRHELSVRAALGAGRGRLLRQLLTESLLLSLAGGAVGVALAVLLLHLVSTRVTQLISVYSSIFVDGRVLLFALGLTLFAALLFGLAPAWRASRVQLQQSLGIRGDTSRTAMPIAGRQLLVGAQIALCVVLLVGAGLLARSLGALARVPVGFTPGHLLTLQFRLPPAKYPNDARIVDMFTRTLGEIRSVPGVRSAALVRATPLNGNGETALYALEAREGAGTAPPPALQLNIVSPGYFETMSIPRLAGRDFTMQDRDGSLPVAIVNEQLARKISPVGSALGRRIRIGGVDDQWATVIGVVGNTKQFRLAEATLDQAYVPYMQRPLIFTEVVVRTTPDPMAVANAIRGAIWRVDRDQPVWRVRPVRQVIDETLGIPALTTWLAMSFALLALLLATVGVYGVTSYNMAARTAEVGVRMALGARSSQVLLMVVRQGMTTVLLALASGLVAALAATRLMSSQLFGIRARDPVTFGAVSGALALVALVACWLPARRASRVDPVVALRAD